MRETIVIGAGLAGLMGALALAESGKRPLVLAKGNGATHWAAGTIDVWGQPGASSLHQALDQVITERPGHPYHLVGFDGLQAAIERFRALMIAARYPYVGTLDRNVLLPTAVGALRPAALVPAMMAAGDMRLGGEVLIAGFHELRDFFPPLAAGNLAAQGFPARGIYLDLPSVTKRHLDFNTRSFAELFDQPAFRQDVGRQLRAARGNATRIGMPAVLGLHDPIGVLHELQSLSGAQVFEIPTLTPSVPGMRIYRILYDAIIAAGGRFQMGSEVLHGAGDSTTLTAIYSEAAAREQLHQARGFLLATGGITGGGIRTDHTGKVWETALGLPVHAPDGREAWFASRFLHEGGHPIFSAGVAVNARQRPLDALGAVVYENVVVAGQALAGADTLRERCSTGVALATGWRAGQLLAA